MYRHFIFDLYGTLADIRTDEEDPKIWRSLAEHTGIPVSADLKGAYAVVCREMETRKSAELAAMGIPGPAEIDILKVWEHLFPDAESRQISRLFRRLTTRKLALYPGARQILQDLRKQGHTVTLLSNAQESFTLPELKLLGIDACFDHIFLSSRYGVKKPSPAFFGLLRQAGMDPADCLMIGNDDVCDCRGAAEAGMDSLYIRTEQSPPLSGPLPHGCRQIASLWDIWETGQ